MKISATDVDYVARLANLEVAEDEREVLAEQLSRIVEFFDQLNALDTEAVPPTSQVVAGGAHPERTDEAAARAGSADAAERVGLFKVPRVITER